MSMPTHRLVAEILMEALDTNKTERHIGMFATRDPNDTQEYITSSSPTDDLGSFIVSIRGETIGSLFKSEYFRVTVTRCKGEDKP